LSDEAENVAQVLEEIVFESDREDEWYNESNNVQFNDHIQELLGLQELELNEFLSCFQFIEV